MPIRIPQGYVVESADPVDSRLLMSQEEMHSIMPASMPDHYFTICKDDGKLYLFDKAKYIATRGAEGWVEVNDELKESIEDLAEQIKKLNDDIAKKQDQLIAGENITLIQDSEGNVVISASDGEAQNAYDDIRKIEDYLFETRYSRLDYKFADRYYRDYMLPPQTAVCSSVRSGNFYGRNFDWLYDNSASFIVSTPKMLGRHATLGVSGLIPELTDEFVSSEAYSELFKIVPFKLLDGINDCGVFVNTNVVPIEKGETTGTTPTEELRDTVCNVMLPRYILDRFESAAEAVDYLKKYVSVYRSASLAEGGLDVHLMVGDEEETYIIEFIDNEISVEKKDKPIMTNFFVTAGSGIVFNEDGSVYTPKDHFLDASHSPMDVNKITSHGDGLERFNIANSAYDSLDSKEAMRALMNELKYTNTYTKVDDLWYSECVGEFDYEGEHINLTLNGSDSLFDAIIGFMKLSYEGRARGSVENPTWQTVHSSVYNIADRKLYVIAQENGKEFEFELDIARGKGYEPDYQSITLNESNRLEIEGFEDAHHGQMPVKDMSSESEQIVWIDPVSDESLQRAVVAAEASARQAGTYSINAGNSAASASTSAQLAERINETTMKFVEDKFWWGGLSEYNRLEKITEGTFYFVQLDNEQPVANPTELKEALAKGGVVSLKNSMNVGSAPIVVEKDTVLYLDGNTLSSTNARVLEVADGASLKIRGSLAANGESLIEGSSSSKPVVFIGNNSNVTIENCVITNTTGKNLIQDNGKDNNVNVTLENCILNGQSYLPAGGNYVFKDCVGNGRAYSLYFKAGNVIIDGGEYSATYADPDWAHYGNGCLGNGHAVVAEACNYPGGDLSVSLNNHPVFTPKESEDPDVYKNYGLLCIQWRKNDSQEYPELNVMGKDHAYRHAYVTGYEVPVPGGVYYHFTDDNTEELIGK